MGTTGTSLARGVVLALFSAPLHSSPVAADNYDFASFGRAVAWTQEGNFGGWNSTSVDVNGDRRIDLVLYSQDSGAWRTWVALSNGDGTFGLPVPWRTGGDWLDSKVLAADVNGDERADLICLTQRAEVLRISVAASNGDGRFQASAITEVAGDYTSWTSALGDVNGDSRRDLVLQTVNGTRWLVHVALNRGNGTFAVPVEWIAFGDFHDAHVGVGDFDGDSRTDVALGSNGYNSWQSWVALSIGEGKFSTPFHWSTPGEFSAWTPARADFDGDGRTDLQLWARDAGGWRSKVARSDGGGSFLPPVTWTTEGFGDSSLFGLEDFNGDGASDMVAQQADGKGWQVRVAISLGNGTFVAPKLWVALDENVDGWTLSPIDVSGDGRADVVAHSADAMEWRASSALSRACSTVIRNGDDFVSRIAGLPNLVGGQVVCFEPGVYEGELLVADKRDFAFVAPRGKVNIESTSVVYNAGQGRDPGAPIQVWGSESIEFDGFTVKNRFTYQLPSGEDQSSMVSRAVEVIQSKNIKFADSHLIGKGKQAVFAHNTRDLILTATFIECYYFCVDMRSSTLRAWGSRFRANHVQTPIDDHAIFWTDRSDQTYVNSTLEFATGKAVFAGVNDFNQNVLEMTGDTVVSPNAEGWVAQRHDYNGINLRLRGTYTPLAEWYFVRGAGRQQSAQVCQEPEGGWNHCVQSIGTSLANTPEFSPIRSCARSSENVLLGYLRRLSSPQELRQ